MEEVNGSEAIIVKYSCKFCNKSFTCGRSLGGHMRSHLRNLSQSEKLNKETSLDHSHLNQKLVMEESRLDDEIEVGPSRKTRLKRSKTRYTTSTTASRALTCSNSFVNASISSTSDQIEDHHEQEEIALCLMMLSRDMNSSNLKLKAEFEVGSSLIDEIESNQLSARFTSSKHNMIKNSGQQKRRSFKCISCNRSFQSYQALGGHRASHKKIQRNCLDYYSTLESNENNIISDMAVTTNSGGSSGSYNVEKSKGYECLICFKAFSSGQALGGHKRCSHRMDIRHEEEKPKNMIVIQKSEEEMGDILDLNLPAPIEEDLEESYVKNGDSLEPWWVDRQKELLVRIDL